MMQEQLLTTVQTRLCAQQPWSGIEYSKVETAVLNLAFTTFLHATLQTCCILRHGPIHINEPTLYLSGLTQISTRNPHIFQQ